MKRAISLVLFLAVVAFAVLAVADSWSDVRESLDHITVLSLVVAFVTGIASTWTMFRAWRTILHGLHADSLSSRDSHTMFFCSQLGKYVPGSVWPAVIQSEIGARSNVPRAVVVTSYTFGMIAAVGVGGLFAGGVLTGDVSGWLVVGALGAIAGGALLCATFAHPRGTQRLWKRLLGKRNPAGGLRDLPMADTVVALAWTAFGWMFLGLHAWVLSRPFGADAGDVVLVTGAFALAWVAGLAALPLPAGAGLREAVLVIALGPLLGRPAAISVALVSRLLMVVADILLALLAGLPRVLHEVRARRSAPAVDR